MSSELHQQHPPPPPPLPRLTSCPLHPDLPFTGFCTSCLRERLAGLDLRPSSKPSSALLRRCKSFSFGRDPPPNFEPQRRSCDVRARNNLSSLFHLDNARFEEEEEQSHEVPRNQQGEIDAPILEEEVRPMKEHIDLDAHARRPVREIAGSFWFAASVFRRKLKSWRSKQKLKKQSSKIPPPGKPAIGRLRETQSEVAEDALGRRSCDTDPRFSLDAGRFSLDDPRYCIEEPRTSWDGYLHNRSVFSRMPSMLSFVEDDRAAVVQRSDGLIPVEEDQGIPGGNLQTREYYSDARRRRSLDRSGSVRKPPTVVEHEEFTCVSNAKVSNYDCAESFNYKENSNMGLPPKKPRRWSKAWSLWGLIQRRGQRTAVERSMSESWTDARRNSCDTGAFRSTSNMSGRHSFSGIGAMGGTRRSGADTDGHRRKRREESMLERNRSARYSPGRIDNGMLRFYLTPMRSSRWDGVGVARINGSNPIPRSVLRLY